MILGDRFVYIHYPKTGGTFVSAMLHKLHAGKGYKTRLARMLGVTFGKAGGGIIDTAKYTAYPKKHAGCRQIPLSFKGKPIISTIRNPYDLYVSMYEYGWWKTNPEHLAWDVKKLLDCYPHFPEISFNDYVAIANNWEFQELKTPKLEPERFLGRITRDFMFRFFKKPLPEILATIDKSYIDSQKYREDMFPAHFLKTNSLNQDLFEFLANVGYDSKNLNFIIEHDKVMPSTAPKSGRREEQKWEKYYTTETKQIVREKERILFSIFPKFDI